jgi:hypothetical protein
MKLSWQLNAMKCSWAAVVSMRKEYPLFGDSFSLSETDVVEGTGGFCAYLYVCIHTGRIHNGCVGPFSLCAQRGHCHCRRHHCRIKITGPMRNMSLRIVSVWIGHRITILLSFRAHETLIFISLGRNSCIRYKFLVLWSPLFCVYFLIKKNKIFLLKEM